VHEHRRVLGQGHESGATGTATRADEPGSDELGRQLDHSIEHDTPKHHHGELDTPGKLVRQHDERRKQRGLKSDQAATGRHQQQAERYRAENQHGGRPERVVSGKQQQLFTGQHFQQLGAERQHDGKRQRNRQRTFEQRLRHDHRTGRQHVEQCRRIARKQRRVESEAGARVTASARERSRAAPACDRGGRIAIDDPLSSKSN